MKKIKTNKLLTAINDFFDESKKKQQGKKKYLKKVLKLLKAKQKELCKKLEAAKEKGTNKSDKKEIEVIVAQRRKGLKLLKHMK